MKARFVFNLSIGVNLLKSHFVDEVKAFTDHASHRTMWIKLIFEGSQLHYIPYEVRKVSINENP